MVGSGGVGLVVALALLFATGPARADDAPRLDYALGDGTATCPSEREFRAAVAARLGREAFGADSKRTLAVTIRLENADLVATGALVEADGSAAGLRRLTGKPDGCRELSDGMALAVSLALNAASGELGAPLAPPPSPSDPPPLAPPSAAPAPRRVAPPPPAAAAVSAAPRDEGADAASKGSKGERLVFGAGVAGHAAFGVGPGTGVGGSLFAQGRLAPWSLSVEARIDGLSRAPFDTGGNVTTSLLAGVVAPCRHFGIVPLCLLGLAGSIRGESKGVSSPDSDAAPYAALGARVGVEWPLTESLLLEGRADGLVTLLPVDIEFGGESVWSSPPYSATLGAGLTGLFP